MHFRAGRKRKAKSVQRGADGTAGEESDSDGEYTPSQATGTQRLQLLANEGVTKDLPCFSEMHFLPQRMDVTQTEYDSAAMELECAGPIAAPTLVELRLVTQLPKVVERALANNRQQEECLLAAKQTASPAVASLDE